jgi:hypothetical protein
MAGILVPAGSILKQAIGRSICPVLGADLIMNQ